MEAQMLQLAQMEHLSSADAVWLNPLDNLLPPTAVSTNDWSDNRRYIKGRNELPAKWTSALTPYAPGIMEAADLPQVRVIGIEGNARSGKTVIMENIAMKRWAHGPYGDMLWYMQSSDDIEDYMEERGEWNLENHEQIAAKIDPKYKKNARDRKRIGASLARWLAATKKTTRGKGAPLIFADEIDAYQKAILKGLLVLLLNRQREFGSAALLVMGSHPDAGPEFGIARVIQDGIRHLWWWTCLHCGGASSPSPYAATRMNWNMPELFSQLRDVERTDAIAYAREHVRLVCPHCQGEITNAERKIMSRESGAWLQPHQQLIGPKKVEGERLIQEIMGFTIHAFMSEFIQLGEAAPEWMSGMFSYEDNGDDELLRQATVKTLGEVMQTADEDQRLDDWEVLRKRMLSGSQYKLKTVPPGVDFLVAFVDVQKRGFEVRVIGYSARGKESWLIDAYLLGTRLEEGRKLDKIDPFLNLDDWDVLEDGVLNQSYPLQSDPGFHMPIAKVGVDAGGGGDKKKRNATVTANARSWAAKVLHRKESPVQEWRLMLMRGAAHKKGELYGVPKQIEKDDRGRALAGPVWERMPNTHDVKRIVRSRQNVSEPGPGFMHAPQDLEDRYFRELGSEKLIGDDWIQKGPNETWDAYVAGEVIRETLKPDRQLPAPIDWSRPPVWARPFRPGTDAGIDTKPRTMVSLYARMAQINRGEGRADGLPVADRRGSDREN
jgi:phage terminase large subunit GpA-like protein